MEMSGWGRRIQQTPHSCLTLSTPHKIKAFSDLTIISSSAIYSKVLHKVSDFDLALNLPNVSLVFNGKKSDKSSTFKIGSSTSPNQDQPSSWETMCVQHRDQAELGGGDAFRCFILPSFHFICGSGCHPKQWVPSRKWTPSFIEVIHNTDEIGTYPFLK